MTTGTPLLESLGRRVRAHRNRLELTLAELAGRAALSVRFLSDLEAGRGNISVARLAAVAAALDVPLDRLFEDDKVAAGASPPRAALAAELAALGDDQVAETLEWVRSRGTPGTGSEKVALIGLRGAGKTTLGRAAAKRLRIAFVELDQQIEEAAGMPLADVFGIHGEPYYRRLEREQLRAAVRRRGRTILAIGGGIVTDAESFELLRRSCFTIWLEASPEDHMQRVVAQGDHRPIKGGRGREQAMAELRAILAARSRLYAQAHARIDTSALGEAGALVELTRLANARGRGR